MTRWIEDLGLPTVGADVGVVFVAPPTELPTPVATAQALAPFVSRTISAPAPPPSGTWIEVLGLPIVGTDLAWLVPPLIPYIPPLVPPLVPYIPLALVEAPPIALPTAGWIEGTLLWLVGTDVGIVYSRSIWDLDASRWDVT